MNGIMNKNQLTIVKEHEFIKPLIQKIDSVIDNCIRDCNNKYFHTFDHICAYVIKIKHITNNEIINFAISDKSVNLYELNKKLKIAGQIGFIFNQIKNFNIKIYSNLSHINIHYYLKHRIPMCHRLFFKRSSQNHEYIQTHCNNRNNHFHFACRQWYSYNNPEF